MKSSLAWNSLDHLVIGYPKLAGRMEQLPETAIFRRFDALNARNLLYLQAELTSIEEDLINLERKDSIDSDKQRYATDWYWLSQSQDQGSTDQLDLVHKMRATLKQYSMSIIIFECMSHPSLRTLDDALHIQAKIHKLDSPDDWDMETIQLFLESRAMRSELNVLKGSDATIWGLSKDPKSYKPDLIALRRRKRRDPFSTWLAESAIAALTHCGLSKRKRPSKTHGTVGIQDHTIVRITLGITTVLASLIPLASIALLYFVHDIRARLSIIAVFNLLVSTCLSFFTNATRSEIFAVSAA